MSQVVVSQLVTGKHRFSLIRRSEEQNHRRKGVAQDTELANAPLAPTHLARRATSGRLPKRRAAPRRTALASPTPFPPGRAAQRCRCPTAFFLPAAPFLRLPPPLRNASVSPCLRLPLLPRLPSPRVFAPLLTAPALPRAPCPRPRIALPCVHAAAAADALRRAALLAAVAVLACAVAPARPLRRAFVSTAPSATAAVAAKPAHVWSSSLAFVSLSRRRLVAPSAPPLSAAAYPLQPALPPTDPRLVAASKPPVRKSLLVLASAMFAVGAALAAAETAITTLWPWKVRELAEKEGESSPFAILESDLTRFLTTILVTTTSATVLSTAIATEVAGDFFGPAAVGAVTAVMTVFFLFFGEILPKALAVHAPAKVARVMVPVISTLSVIVYPVGKLLAWVSSHILRILKLPMENDATVSEEELRLIVAGADRSGSIEKYESQIIHNVLDLEETDVREVMCPRVDMVALPVTNTLAELLQSESESHYSRMPVYDGTIDNIVGVAMAKSLLRYLNEDASLLQSTRLSEIIDPAFFVPESMSVWIALEEMRKRRLHMAIVVDEYGGTAGLVTLEDILEEVVGEIYDEDDDVEAQAQVIEKADDGRFLVDGQGELEKVGETLALNLTEDDLHDYGTISGFLCARMGGIPNVGDEVVFNKVRFTVTEADDRRIIGLRAEVLTEEELERITEDEERAREPADSEVASELGNIRNGLDPIDTRKGSTSSDKASGNGQSDDFGLGNLFSGIVGNDSSKSIPQEAPISDCPDTSSTSAQTSEQTDERSKP